ncbi:Gametocyte-specific factor 1 [Anthophora quadrimaculata]
MYKPLIDPIMRCPYNKSHSIVKSRLQKHIVKCEKNYPDHYKVMCPYNATHRLFKIELEEHIITCPTRSVLETEMYTGPFKLDTFFRICLFCMIVIFCFTEPKKHGSTNFALHSEISSTIDCTENWDLEIDINSTISTENYSLNNDKETYKAPVDFRYVRYNTDDTTEIRAPRGFPEVMLRDVDEESCIEDVESVNSSMGIGRGKVIWGSNKLRLVGLGRGCPINTDLQMEMFETQYDK